MLQVYKASAGAGKTFTLTEEYLQLLFANTQNYRHTLAVTFTNKASGEMKDRIIASLYSLCSDSNSPYFSKIELLTGKNKAWIRVKAQGILREILHNYSFFFIETIDSFFQRIIRNFAKEFGLFSYFGLELNQKEIIEKAIHKLFLNLPENQDTFELINAYSQSKIDEGLSRNVISNLQDAAQILFNELFMQHAELFKNIDLTEFFKTIKSNIKAYENEMVSHAQQILALLKKYNLSADDFKGKKNGFLGRIEKLAKHPSKLEGFTKVQEGKIHEVTEWYTKTSSRIADIEAFAAEGALKNVLAIINGFNGDKNIEYNTAKLILATEYTTQLLHHIQQQIDEYLQEENLFLISNTNNLVQKLISGSDAPFVYEKIGCYIKNIMIDEFQDTSRMQWENFKPLLQNVMAEDGYSLVVGDVKQSIYRFRNGDWKILQNDVHKEFSYAINETALLHNWRSKRNVIDFNNNFFEEAAKVLANSFDAYIEDSELDPIENLSDVFPLVYSDVQQNHSPKTQDGGHVSIQYVEAEKDDFEDEIYKRLVKQIIDLHKANYVPDDITFLARSKKEISKIVQYCNNAKIEFPEYEKIFSVVSAEALLIDSSNAVQFILAYFQWLDTPYCKITKTVLLRFYGILHNVETDVLPFSEFEELFEKQHLIKAELSLFEIAESVIREFGLHLIEAESAYIHAFQDILHSYSQKQYASISKFIEWWSESKDKQYLTQTETQGSMQAMTIHKSKGLQFKVVLMPYVNWQYTSLKHSMLVSTQHTQYADLPLIKVNYGKGLAKTAFKEQFIEESMQVYLDNLNLLYVACTRAEEVLSLFVQVPKKRSLNKMDSFILNTLDAIFARGEANMLSEFVTENNFSFGKLLSTNTERKESQQILQTEYPVFTSQGILLPNPEAIEYFNYQKESSQKNYGLAMHKILETTIVVNDLKKSVEKSVWGGYIEKDKASEIYDELYSKITSDKVCDWFSAKYKVLNEQSILLPTAEEKRPDRIMVNGTSAIIVDYKFTTQTSLQHQEQVRSYVHTIKDMGFEIVKGYVWYVITNVIVEV